MRGIASAALALLGASLRIAPLAEDGLGVTGETKKSRSVVDHDYPALH
jgi:hypothetical protein